MKKFFLPFLLIFFFINCVNQKTNFRQQINSSLPIPIQTVEKTPTPTAENTSTEEKSVSDEPETQYPGITIDQEFPFIEEHSFSEISFREKTYFVNAEDFQVKFTGFKPKTIEKDGKILLDLKLLFPDDYSSNVIGISHLLGKSSKEIYIATTGGMCCTNYLISDISNGKPRVIFRSEDYIYSRDPIEIFDADGDGIYEIMQSDSSFRYFLDDCGTCSPEPRAVFKYDKKAGKYLPAKGIQQDYEKEGLERWEKEIMDTFQKMKETNDRTLQHQLNREVRAYVVDLIYVGEENKAWQFFNKYFPEDYGKKETRAEIKRILSESKFYQALKKSS